MSCRLLLLSMISPLALACSGGSANLTDAGTGLITYEAHSPTAGVVRRELTDVKCVWSRLDDASVKAKHALEVQGVGTDGAGRSSMDAFAHFSFDEETPTSRTFSIPSSDYPFNAWFTLRDDLICAGTAPSKVKVAPTCELHVDEYAGGRFKGRIDCSSLPEQANPFVEETAALVSVQASFDCPVTHEDARVLR